MKINHNLKYTTIAIYTVFVFFACILVYKVVFSWNDSMALIRSLLNLMSPFIFALLIAFFISPMVNFLERLLINRISYKGRNIKSLKIKRVLSIILAYFIVIGSIMFLFAIVMPQVFRSFTDISNKLPGYIDSVIEWSQTASFSFGTENYYIDFKLLSAFVSENIPQTLEQITDIFNQFMPEILNFTKNIASVVMNLFFGFIIAIYLIYNKEAYLKNAGRFVTAIIPPQANGAVFNTFKESHRIFSSFFIGKLLDSLIIGLLCFFILLISKIPYPILISVIIGVTNMIPYFGPFIGGFIGILFLLIGSPEKVLLFAIIILALQQFDGNILGPKILGDSTGLEPFWVIFAIILFGGMFGFIGMFVGVPFFAVIKNIIDHVIDRHYNRKIALIEALDDSETNPYKL
ncbi:AI-2E family transporter [Petrocella sp. FN5]|uniref:AI-2E family transporter n=1 Tax=Petrocella sp. FN5 TaxID=3032002 RepID=UPI0023DA0D3A|nr:AI-2E family transporter [Petrocella sp. FN5]MDF1618366.1 AI-2E family transporter [Petrocella sp. FN5]